MKKLLTSLLLLCTIASFAQDNDDHRDKDRKEQQNNSQYYNVPDNVQRSFQQDYPNGRNPRWQNNNGQWHAIYRDQDDRDHDAYYDNNGRRLEMQNGDRNRGQGYNETELPYKLKRKLDRRYRSGYRTNRIYREGSPAIFEITFDNGNVMYYDESGRRVNYVPTDDRDRNRGDRERESGDRDRDNH